VLVDGGRFCVTAPPRLIDQPVEGGALADLRIAGAQSKNGRFAQASSLHL